MVTMLLAFQSAPLTISNPDMTLSALSLALSRSGQSYSVDPRIGQRRVAVFVTGKKANDIAKMVALTLGVKLKGTRFEPDTSYEASRTNHEAWLRKLGVEALRRAIKDLRVSPPKWVGEQKGRYDRELSRRTTQGWMRPPDAFDYRRSNNRSRQDAVNQWRDAILGSSPEAIVLLSSLSGSAVEQFMQGRYMVGSIPQRPNTFYMAKATTLFKRLSTFKQAYVMLQYNAAQNYMTRAYYSPGMEHPNAYTDNIYFGSPNTLESYTPLGLRWKGWDKMDYKLMDKIYPVMSQPGNATDSILIQRVAKAVQVPLVAERHDHPDGPLRPDWSRLSAYKRSEEGWLLLKPTLFWIDPVEKGAAAAPTGGTILERLNWAANSVNSMGMGRRYSEREGTSDLDTMMAKFWVGLSSIERTKLLGAGLKASELSAASQGAFFDAAIRLSLTRAHPKGDMSMILERSPSVSIKIQAHEIWSVFRQDANGSSGGVHARRHSDAERYMREPQYRGSKMYAGVGYTLRISSPKGYLEDHGNLRLGELKTPSMN
ncbi:MAG: hypothetical protein ABL962_00695 [Fimbriimonadaceae bacterium]